jgi:hypothetical protein
MHTHMAHQSKDFTYIVTTFSICAIFLDDSLFSLAHSFICNMRNCFSLNVFCNFLKPKNDEIYSKRFSNSEKLIGGMKNVCDVRATVKKANE